MSEEQLNEMLENIENAMWQLKNCKCNVDVTSKGHKWETYYGLDNDLIGYIRKIEKELQQKENIIKEVREYMNKHEIEEVYLDCKLYETQAYKDILEILDKENN